MSEDNSHDGHASVQSYAPGWANEATDLRMDRLAGEYGDPATQAARAESYPREHFAPLIREADALLDDMAAGVRGYDPLQSVPPEPKAEEGFGRVFHRATNDELRRVT